MLKNSNFRKSTSSHTACRSLLQKSIRRGDTVLTEKILRHLREAGELQWVKKRAGVILIEECWPLTNQLHGANEVFQLLLKVASSRKHKDAAGLGSLGFALFNGDGSALANDANDKHIRIIAEAIRRPEDFWNWALGCSDSSALPLIKNAHSFYKVGGWPWDLAFMQAAAYLAVVFGIPQVITTDKVMKVPLFTGLDKHTPMGKIALAEAAKQIRCDPALLSDISFYVEGASCNDLAKSIWWDKEIRWKFSKYGIDLVKAHKIWRQAKPIITSFLSEEIELLRHHINFNEQEELPLS